MATTAVDSRLIVALDFADAETALAFARELDPAQCRVKVGKGLFTRAGPRLVEELQAAGFGVFLDLKFHDIPNTVANACAAARDLGVWMVNVHALGGNGMMSAARHALGDTGDRPLLTAVTVLTSLDAQDLAMIGFDIGPEALVLRLAEQAASAGCDGVVCSAREAAALRSAHGDRLLRVTPGIRAGSDRPDDQRRTLTATEALRAGADHLVVGRPITRAHDPRAALRELTDQVRRFDESA